MSEQAVTTKGRKRLSPYERLYFQRPEVIILLGIWIKTKEAGGSAQDAIETLKRYVNLPEDRSTDEHYRRQLNMIVGEFRGIIKDLCV